MRKKPKKLKKKPKTQEKNSKLKEKNSMSRRIAPLLTSQVVLKKKPGIDRNKLRTRFKYFL